MVPKVGAEDRLAVGVPGGELAAGGCLCIPRETRDSRGCCPVSGSLVPEAGRWVSWVSVSLVSASLMFTLLNASRGR